jgi:ribosomal protein L16 Arg81 hydroxylase
VRDVTDPALDLTEFPRIGAVTFHEIVLEAGECLFIPIGWWHQVEALDFSVSLTFTNFRWRNDWYKDFPA